MEFVHPKIERRVFEKEQWHTRYIRPSESPLPTENRHKFNGDEEEKTAKSYLL